MKSVLYGISAMIVVSVIAWAITGMQSTDSDEAFVSKNKSVRLD